MGVGRPSLPTPAGHFYLREKLRAIGAPMYGPYALGTSAYAPKLTDWPGGGVVGIHGTDEPRAHPGPARRTAASACATPRSRASGT